MNHSRATTEDVLPHYDPCVFMRLFHYEPCRSCKLRPPCENYRIDNSRQNKVFLKAGKPSGSNPTEALNTADTYDLIRRANDSGAI